MSHVHPWRHPPLHGLEPRRRCPLAAGGEACVAQGVPAPGALAARISAGLRGLRLRVLAAAVLLFFAGLSAVVVLEVVDGGEMAFRLARTVRDARFEVAPGPAPVPYPHSGPYDVRLGHSRIPAFLDRLRAGGATVEAQARWTPALDRLVEGFGLFPPYAEKDRAGLRLLDDAGRTLHRSLFPERVVEDPRDLPPLVADMVVFLENRELQDDGRPFRNPAVEWDRLAFAAGNRLLQRVGVPRPTFGGSTLATQIEKFRHSAGGRTGSVREKARQIASASLKAYLDGPSTREARPRILLTWLNSLPLGAVPGQGEVLGLGDGLWAWFGRDLDEALGRLRDPDGLDPDDPEGADRALACRQVLALLLAQRRPAFYRGEGREALESLVDAFTRRLAAEGILSPTLRDRVLATRLAFRDRADPPEVARAPEAKGRDAVRIQALRDLGLPDLYDLEHLDLTLESTLDGPRQAQVARTLRDLADPAYVARTRLRQAPLLSRGDPAGVLYSVNLYERVGEASLLRVQVDGYDGPFSLNDGMKLELGSTAKLRTLVSYLEAVAEIRDRLAARPGSAGGDPLSRWVAGRVAARPGEDLAATLDAALDRRYPASPDEAFYTGGGLHRFVNFHARDDRTAPTVREAFHQSVNLVFVRVLRDVVRYRVEAGPAPGSAVLADPKHPLRRGLLERFADLEGSVFQQRFHEAYGGLPPGEALERLGAAVGDRPQRLAVAFRSVRPGDDDRALAAFLARHAPAWRLSERRVRELFDRSDPARLALADRGWLSRRHPLELWTVAWLDAHPGGRADEMLAASAAERVDAYGWLYRDGRKAAQDRRIRDVLERDAFARIHEGWARLGYPFPTLVPSLATALGSSGDRPRALAELVGILQAGGMRYPVERIERWRFAEGTPYETVVRRPDGLGVRVLRPEIADAVRREMVQVVEAGTAHRLKGALRDADGRAVEVGGKTGTGDNREDVVAPDGRTLSSRVLSRTATFAFFAGERWFGVVTAHVPGAAAEGYRFTSALPVEVVRRLAPALEGVGERTP